MTSGGELILTWGDDFSGPAGSPPDTQVWSAVVNGLGGGNQELEYYIPGASVINGKGTLQISAQRSSGEYEAWYGPSQFTSGKMWTRGRLSFRYGHLEVRAAFPCAGRPGAWPAIWMLGANYSDVGWPECGEIDIFESFGRDANACQVSAAVHSSSGSRQQFTDLPAAGDASKFHVYTLDWSPTSLELGLDGKTSLTVSKRDFSQWPFDQPFFLILNLAIGGTMGGDVPASEAFPYTAQFDYVNLYNSEVFQADGLVG